MIMWVVHIKYNEETIAMIFRCLRVTYRRVLDRMIGFIDTLYTAPGTTGNYTANAHLHILEFTVTHT
jgi:hypothetical protein